MSCCNETGDVRHVDHQVRADTVRDVPETLPVNNPRIGRESRDNQLRLVLIGKRLHLVVVDKACFGDETVLHGVIQTA